MRRLWKTWFQFAVCTALVLAAMAQVSLTALRLDREQAERERHERCEDVIRLALLRMETHLTPLVGREGSRAMREYAPFYPARNARTRSFAWIREGEVLIPSPLLLRTSPDVLLHFQFAPDGTVTSPQAPSGPLRAIAVAQYGRPPPIQVFESRLQKVRDLFEYEPLLARLRNPYLQAGRPSRMARASRDRRQREPPLAATQARIEELRQRKRTVQEALPQFDPDQRGQRGDANARSERVGSGLSTERAMTPFLADNELFLARWISQEEGEYVQGCWIDWQGLRERLRHSIRDLLPDADLALHPTSFTQNPFELQRQNIWPLAAIGNIRLIPGHVPLEASTRVSAIELSLIFAWVCMLAAAAAVGALLHGAVSLSERRAAFVSAVTHELRTPLTTFRMYTEMLSDDMVPDGPQRRRYFDTMLV
jgi:signal transduction histidine kinase